VQSLPESYERISTDVSSHDFHPPTGNKNLTDYYVREREMLLNGVERNNVEEEKSTYIL
jgi:hypothetical protein